MDAFLPPLLVLGGLAAAVAAFARLARRVRRRGTAGAAAAAALASWEEAFRVTSHEAYQEVRVQAERTPPRPSPDGPGGRERYRRPPDGVTLPPWPSPSASPRTAPAAPPERGDLGPGPSRGPHGTTASPRP
ncbi:hypothetical protein [Streptomyces abyssomicinicus]|uniref:hypothetical protein n=1 Tax=Streptomyces abyssomicinicus TaxID=574929 RepID=UPI001FE9E391|nr:hypothetical protein [Streptomyces abyssomicinicus]